MKNKKTVLLVILILLVLGAVFWIINLGDGYIQQVSGPEETPVDVVINFYDPWVIALQATTTDPYKENLHKNSLLSRELSKKIADGKSKEKEYIDPVLCQIVSSSYQIPTLATLLVYETEDTSEVVVSSRDVGVTRQAVIKLLKKDGGWYMDDIKCTEGEFGEEKEFNFEELGYLIKSVPAPFNPEYWHLVSEVDGELTFVTPLFFNSESICIPKRGESYVCNPNDLSETTKVRIYGSLDETGATVAKMEFVD